MAQKQTLKERDIKCSSHELMGSRELSDKVGFRRELLNIRSDKLNSIDIINIDELKSCPKMKKYIIVKLLFWIMVSSQCYLIWKHKVTKVDGPGAMKNRYMVQYMSK